MNEYRKEFSETSREVRWTFWKVFWIVIAFVTIVSIAGYILGWFGESARVAKDEFGPKAALEKYEWFVDYANKIKKMEADVTIFENRITDLKSEYKVYGENPAKWPLDVRTQYNHSLQIAKDDLVATISQRNSLVMEYNAASDKFNWAPFKERDDFPGQKFLDYKSELLN